jgi:hypothetical protein
MSDDLSNEELADRFINSLASDGINESSITEENEDGLGTAIENALSKIGISSQSVERMFGVGGCGCGGRKKFLNKIFPFFKKAQHELSQKESEDSTGVAPINRRASD